MKKKSTVSSKDKKEWIDFTNQIGNIHPKEADFSQTNTRINKVRKLDLHGYSISESNKIVKKFIIESFENGFKKLLIVTGKGLRSRVYNNPYLSEQMNVLKHSVPEFIKNDEDLFKKIRKISTADLKDGGEGAFYIFFKKVKNYRINFDKSVSLTSSPRFVVT